MLIDIKTQLTIMTRVSFADMYDSLNKLEKDKVNSFIRTFCNAIIPNNQLLLKLLDEVPNQISEESEITECEQYRLIPYINEETNTKYGKNFDHRLKASDFFYLL